MSMSAELKQLKKQRRAAVDHLQDTYLATKRDVRRKLSPDRLMRKHLGASLGVAAVAGMLLAPRPTPPAAAATHTDSGEKKPGGKSARGGMWSQVLRNVLKQVDPRLAAAFPAQEQGHDKGGGGGRGGQVLKLVQAVMPVLLSKIDVHKLIAKWTQGMRGHEDETGHDHDGHSPEMSVADVGTVKPE